MPVLCRASNSSWRAIHHSILISAVRNFLMFVGTPTVIFKSLNTSSIIIYLSFVIPVCLLPIILHLPPNPKRNNDLQKLHEDDDDKNNNISISGEIFFFEHFFVLLHFFFLIQAAAARARAATMDSSLSTLRCK